MSMKLENKDEFEIQKMLADAWLNIDVKDESKLFNPLKEIPEEYIDNPQEYITWVMSRPEYFSFLCKYILNVEIYPAQALILEALWNHKFPMLVCSRGWGKSFTLSLYAMIRLILLNKRKIAITGAAFRQAKIIFEYMEGIWNNAPLLRDMIGYTQKNGPRREQDMYRFFIGDSVASAYPLGNGDKIRGQRANDIITDEFASINREILENVIFGFAAVASSPVEKIKMNARRKFAKEHNIIDVLSEDKHEIENQIIISGTAYYQFNHFYDYFKKWKDFINSKGNPDLIRHHFKDGIDPNFNWRDYCIIRVPYELIPEGFMDAGIIARAKATIRSGTYEMEYGACVTPDTKIITDIGAKNIENIIEGDMVLTHKGRFRPVIKITNRQCEDVLNVYKTLGYNQEVSVTIEHPFWIGECFDELPDKTCLSNLKELNNKQYINVENYVLNYLETKDSKYIYPSSSQSKIDVDMQRDIMSSNESQYIIGKRYNLTQTAISKIRNRKTNPKSIINKNIELDRNFGLIVGYYAAEGSVSKNFRQVSFALDEHVNTQFQQQLIDAINVVFGPKAKKYIKQKNTVEICINNRLIGQLFKEVCPGKSHTKFINPDILYSNKEFILGFLEGYCNGDGHISDHHIDITSCSLDLLSQVRTILSYFNISCSINESKTHYNLLMYGNNYKNFMNLVYNKNINLSNYKTKIINNTKYTSLPLLSKKNKIYNGIVYNLEVDEDNSYSLLNATVHNCFSKDSAGFFKRSVIESCVVGPDNPIVETFRPVLNGNPKKQYVYGIDPASEVDNFSIVILEINENHRRVVYGWSTNKKNHNEKLKSKAIAEQDFYAYCIRKIRNLMKRFPCSRIALDSQGGGVAIREGFKNERYLEAGEEPIYEVIDYDSPKDTDGLQGKHILELINFASGDWTSESNHGLRRDLESKILLFPYFDSIEVGMVSMDDIANNRTFDTLEDCVMEIEELKNELSNIIIMKTPNGRDKWDTPEKLDTTNRKVKIRKDRYCALLMANSIAHKVSTSVERVVNISSGGFAATGLSDEEGPLYIGPQWWSNKINGVY